MVLGVFCKMRILCGKGLIPLSYFNSRTWTPNLISCKVTFVAGRFGVLEIGRDNVKVAVDGLTVLCQNFGG